MMRIIFSATLWVLCILCLTCTKDNESLFPTARKGQLLLQLKDLHPADLDSVVFRFTHTTAIVKTMAEDNAIILELASIPLGQHLTEVAIFSRFANAPQAQSLHLKKLHTLNTYILLDDPAEKITISGPGDEYAGWTAHVEAHDERHPERLKVQTLPLTSFVHATVDTAKQVQHLVLSKRATIAGYKAQPSYVSFEKVYLAQEFYQQSSTGERMYDFDGFADFHNLLKSKDVRRMDYTYSVHYTDGSTRALAFYTRL